MARPRIRADWRTRRADSSEIGSTLVEGGTEDVETLLLRVRALAAGQQHAEARQLCARAVELAPTNVGARYVLAVLCGSNNDADAAERHYRAVLAACPEHACSAAAACNLGQTLIARGADDDGVALLRRATTLQPTLAEAHCNLGLALRRRGDAAGALAAAEAAAAHAPTLGPALVLLGELRLESGDDDAAEEAAGAALALAQRAAEAARGAPALLAPACTLAGRALAAGGAYDRAIEAYSAAGRHHADEAPRAHALRAALAGRALRERLAPKEGDIFVATFPKSGTTWAQQIVGMLLGEAAGFDLHTRAPWIEAAAATGALSLAALAALPSPRIFKTHAAASDLPIAGVGADGAPPPAVRVVVVARDPRDVMVSLYHHSRAIKGISWGGTWDEWVALFLRGEAPTPSAAAGDGGGGGGDWVAHTLGWWRAARRWPDRVLWLTYEQLHADGAAAVRRAAAFLGVAPSAARVDEIVAAASFGAMKARHEAGDGGAALRHAGEAAHFRAGRAGGWREQLTGAQQQAVAAAFGARLAGSGLEGTWEGL